MRHAPSRSTACAILIVATLAVVERPDAQTTTALAAVDTHPAALSAGLTPAPAPAERIASLAHERRQDDLAAIEAFRPGYRFWRYIFTIPDGSIAYGSARDGRLLAVFPARGDWRRTAEWKEPSLSGTLAGQVLPRRLTDLRTAVADLLEPEAGPVLHNATRGQFLLPNVKRYGVFLAEWGAIYERFGVPADIGLAQAAIESGLNGTIRSEARALGFCQWLSRNWNQLNRISPHVIEAYNQTTQAPYCAAYLALLATKHGSFIPALSEHHSGGTNVGRQLINGERLGGLDPRTQYLLGAELTRDLRLLAPRRYRDVYGTYGPRSFRYAEMVFGNTYTVAELQQTTPQARIHAMRTHRAIPLAEVTRRTGLSADEVRRYNPALVRQVPARATLYLPRHVADFGTDVAFWHRPPSPAFASALADLLALEATPAEWDAPAFVPVLLRFAERFQATRTEEGTTMATVLAYLAEDIQTSGRDRILADFRTDTRIARLFAEGVAERAAANLPQNASLAEPDEVN
jgi:hypothetical protein